MSAFDKAWKLLKSQEAWDEWEWDNACDAGCYRGYQEVYKKPDGSYGNPEAEDGEWTYELCSECNGTGFKAPIPPQYQQFHDAERA